MLDDWMQTDDPQQLDQQVKNPAQATTNAAPNAGQTSYDKAWNDAAPAASSAPKPSGQMTPDVEPQNYVMRDLGVSPSNVTNPGWEGNDVTSGNPATMPDYSTHVAAVQTATTPQDYLAKQDALARRVAADLQAAGHEVKWQGSQLMVDGRPYEVGGQQWSAPGGGSQPLQSVYDSVRSKGGPNAGSLDELANAYAAAGYQVSRPTYNGVPSGNELMVNGQKLKFTVGDVGNAGTGWYDWGSDDSAPGGAMSGSIAGAPPNYDALWSASEGDPYTPGHIGNEDMPGFTYESLLSDATSGNPVEASTDRAVNDLLAHPESLDARTVQMLEAKDAEEQQQAALQSDESLKRFGFQSGLSDSNWLASERASTARQADANIIGNRRAIETEAAKTNMSDRRAAAQIGTAYQNARASQKQAAVNTAVDGAMKKATETRNRFQLNEDLKVEAAKLKLSKEELVQQYAVAKINDLSKRYGIDLGYDIDVKKLAQQGDQFQSDLLFRLKNLDQQDKQFGANLGLQYDTLNQRALEDYWNHTTGGA